MFCPEFPWCSSPDEVTGPTLSGPDTTVIICDRPRFEVFRNILRVSHPDLHAHGYSHRHLFNPRDNLPGLIRFMHKSCALVKTNVPRLEPK